ncbi:MAG TPA: HAD family hydrolase [Terriglobia bacterium]|nr:HAD family hydrolase [Terriglobia bacterium]
MTVRDKKKKDKAVQAKKAQATGEARPGAPGQQTAVFLDRDGTLNQEVGYINHIDRLRLYPWSAEAIRKLNRAGVPVIVLTNQSGVGRGYFSEELVHRVHQKIALELAASEAHLDAFYYCPHHPDSNQAAYKKKCQCRKPLAGMVDEAAKKFHIDVKSSYVVGDSTRDMEMGFNAGARTVLVMTGYGRGNYENLRGHWPRQPDMIAENLLEAVEKILGELARRAIKPARRDGAPRTS